LERSPANREIWVYPEFGSSFTTKITKGRENKGKTAFTALLFYPEARTH
jgi:hypothetical protein